MCYDKNSRCFSDYYWNDYCSDSLIYNCWGACSNPVRETMLGFIDIYMFGLKLWVENSRGRLQVHLEANSYLENPYLWLAI